MSHSNYTRNILNIKDKNIIFYENCLEEVKIKKITGNTGNKFNIELLNDVKNNLMNIDLMIINELNELFMGIF